MVLELVSIYINVTLLAKTQQRKKVTSLESVSYTHLTLPTILLV